MGDTLNQCMEAEYCIDLYNLIRENNITRVVETGICHGMSSFFILSALPASGLLVSIDPNIVELIPKRNRRWIVIHNKSENCLKTVLREFKAFDLLLHDSDHKYETMKFEYELARKHCRYLASHDINHPGAGNIWSDYKKKYKPKVLLEKTKFGILDNGVVKNV